MLEHANGYNVVKLTPDIAVILKTHLGQFFQTSCREALFCELILLLGKRNAGHLAATLRRHLHEAAPTAPDFKDMTARRRRKPVENTCIFCLLSLFQGKI